MVLSIDNYLKSFYVCNDYKINNKLYKEFLNQNPLSGKEKI